MSDQNDRRPGAAGLYDQVSSGGSALRGCPPDVADAAAVLSAALASGDGQRLDVALTLGDEEARVLVGVGGTVTSAVVVHDDGGEPRVAVTTSPAVVGTIVRTLSGLVGETQAGQVTMAGDLAAVQEALAAVTRDVEAAGASQDADRDATDSLLAAALEATAAAVQEERGRLANRLHDGPIQELTAAQLLLDSVAEVPDAELLAHAAGAVRQAVVAARELMRELAPTDD